MWKENRFGWPLRGVIWFYLAIEGSSALIALAGYAQKGQIDRKNYSSRGNGHIRVGMTMQIT
jgi:hypothetical protein